MNLTILMSFGSLSISISNPSCISARYGLTAAENLLLPTRSERKSRCPNGSCLDPFLNRDDDLPAYEERAKSTVLAKPNEFVRGQHYLAVSSPMNLLRAARLVHTSEWAVMNASNSPV